MKHGLDERLKRIEALVQPEPAHVPYVVWDPEQQAAELAEARAAGRPIINVKIEGLRYNDI